LKCPEDGGEKIFNGNILFLKAHCGNVHSNQLNLGITRSKAKSETGNPVSEPPTQTKRERYFEPFRSMFVGLSPLILDDSL